MRLFIAIPTHGAWAPDFGHSLAVTVADLAATRAVESMRITRCEATILPQGRNDLVCEALREEATHILWVDTDMRFRPLNVRPLIGANEDIVAADYVRKAPPFTQVSKVVSGSNGSGLMEAEHCGMGLMLTSIEVFKKIPQPWFMLQWREETADYVGEDVFFCRKARECGFSIYISRAASEGVGHVGKFVFEQEHAKALEAA